MKESKNIIDKLIEDAKELMTNNPEIIIERAYKTINEKDNEIEELKLSNKALKSRNDYLEGQISVYRNFLENFEEE